MESECDVRVGFRATLVLDDVPLHCGLCEAPLTIVNVETEVDSCTPVVHVDCGKRGTLTATTTDTTAVAKLQRDYYRNLYCNCYRQQLRYL